MNHNELYRKHKSLDGNSSVLLGFKDVPLVFFVFLTDYSVIARRCSPNVWTFETSPQSSNQFVVRNIELCKIPESRRDFLHNNSHHLPSPGLIGTGFERDVEMVSGLKIFSMLISTLLAPRIKEEVAH